MSPIEDRDVCFRRALRSLGPAGLFFSAFLIFAPLLSGQTSSSPPVPLPSPVLNRLRFQREIFDLKIRAIREPASASSIRERLAGLYLKSGQPEKAVTLYRHAIIFDPPRAAAYHRRIALIYRQEGKDEEAEEELRLAAAAAPETAADRRRRQLTAWEEEGRDDLLLQQYRFLYWTQAHSRDEYLKNIARILAGQGEEEKADRYYRMLIASYRERIDERPSSAVSYHLRIAGLYEEMDEPEAAAEEYRRAVEIEGDEGGRALVSEADYYSSRGEVQRAIALYREALSRPGVDRGALYARIATLLEREGEEDAALAELRRAAELEDGGEEEAGIRIIRFFERRGELEEALAGYRALLSVLEPGRRSWAWERIGGLLSRLDREEEAAPAYREALQLREEEQGEENPSAIFLERAISLAGKAGMKELAADYTRQLAATYRLLLDQDPGRAKYYHRKLGDILQRQENFQQAAAHYRAWSGLAPDDPGPHYRLYRLYRDHLDNHRGAERHRERYRELRGNNRGFD